MANRLEIAFIASPALLLVTANEVRQTVRQRCTPVPAEQPWGARCPGRGDPPRSPAGTKPGPVPGVQEGQRAGRDHGADESPRRPSNLSQSMSQQDPRDVFIRAPLPRGREERGREQKVSKCRSEVSVINHLFIQKSKKARAVKNQRAAVQTPLNIPGPGSRSNDIWGFFFFFLLCFEDYYK